MTVKYFYSYTQASSIVGDIGPGYDMAISAAGSHFPSVAIGANTTMDFDASGMGLSDFFVSCYARLQTAYADRPMLTLLGDGGDPMVRLVSVGTAGDAKFEVWDGSAWLEAIASVGSDFEGIYPQRIDVRVRLATDGEIRLYIQSVLVYTFSGDTSFMGSSTLGTLRFNAAISPGTTAFASFGAILVSDTDTRGLFVHASLTSSNGTYNEWNGGEHDVDDYLEGTNSQLTSINATEAGKKQSFNFSNIPSSYDGYEVETVVLGFTGKAFTDPGLELEGITLHGANEHSTGGALTPTAEGRRVYGFEMTTNPDTGLPWADINEVEGVEMGLKTNA